MTTTSEPVQSNSHSALRTTTLSSGNDHWVNYYEILEIPPTCARGRIEAAYLEKMKVWNQRAANPKYSMRAAETKRRLAEARQALIDPLKRKKHDREIALKYREVQEARMADLRGRYLTLVEAVLANKRVTLDGLRYLQEKANEMSLDVVLAARIVDEEAARHHITLPVEKHGLEALIARMVERLFGTPR